MATKVMDRWLRRWSDENGELVSVNRQAGKYFITQTIPAFEPGAGRKTHRQVSLSEAQEYDGDPIGELEYSENQQAKIEHDPFFN